jgi:hypothetical protein
MASKPGTISPDQKTDEEVTETFPASDPMATTATSGARAVPTQDMVERAAPPLPDAVTLHRSFPDAESAKLALEGLVRDGPVDRRLAEITNDNGVALRLDVPANDAERIRGLLERA